jgi:hypothetical protein
MTPERENEIRFGVEDYDTIPDLLAEIDRLRSEYRLPEKGFHRTLQNRIDTLEADLAIAAGALALIHEHYKHCSYDNSWAYYVNKIVVTALAKIRGSNEKA